LNFEHYPEDLKPHHAKYLRKNFPLFARKARHILTVSEFSKQDILRTYGIQEDKISVAHNGVSPAFYVTHESDDTVQEPYFLFVGSIHPRKNLKRLLLAFDSFKSTFNSNHRLRVVGDPYYWTDDMKTTLDNLRNKSAIDFSPYASVEDLRRHYQNAVALMFVSYFEGFGIPVVEAMACGCPVVVGVNTACDEIAASAAHKVDAFDIHQISEAMLLLATNSEYRSTLIDAGLERCKHFTWDETGFVMNRVMHEIL
jgi:glycosyltransferase involved in cell wall biosynthesis